MAAQNTVKVNACKRNTTPASDELVLLDLENAVKFADHTVWLFNNTATMRVLADGRDILVCEELHVKQHNTNQHGRSRCDTNLTTANRTLSLWSRRSGALMQDLTLSRAVIHMIHFIGDRILSASVCGKRIQATAYLTPFGRPCTLVVVFSGCNGAEWNQQQRRR